MLAVAGPALYRGGVDCGACFQVRCKDRKLRKLCSSADAKVVVMDRVGTKSNRTDLMLSSLTFATMAWPHGWPSSAPSMLSTRGCRRASTSGRSSRCGWSTGAARPASWSSRSSNRAAKSTSSPSRHAGQVVELEVHDVEHEPGAAGTAALQGGGHRRVRQEVGLADREVYDTGVQITDAAQEGCFPCDTHE